MLPELYQAHRAVRIVSKDFMMSKRGASGKRKQVTLCHILYSRKLYLRLITDLAMKCHSLYVCMEGLTKL